MRYPSEPDQDYYEIHEVFYGDLEDEPPNKGVAIAESGCVPFAESLDGLRWTLERMLDALKKPVLDYDTREEIAAGGGSVLEQKVDEIAEADTQRGDHSG
jgi:hypothetical protein